MQFRRFLAPASAALLSAALLVGCGTAGQPQTGPGHPGTPANTAKLGHQAKQSAHRIKSAGNHAAHKVTSKANRSIRQSTKGASSAGKSKGKGHKAHKTPKAKGHKGKPGSHRGSGKNKKDHKATMSLAGAQITPAMAPQGASLFRSQGCTSCHGPQGQGTSAAPALNGSGPVPILSTYPTPASLASFIHAYMPLTNPGSLTATQADELAAYLYYTLNHGKATAARTGHGG